MDRKNTLPSSWQISLHASLPQILDLFPKMVMRSAQVYLQKPDPKVSWLTAVAQESRARQGLIVAFMSREQGLLQIASWYVMPEYVNQGIGRRLLKALESWCRKQGIRRMAFDVRDGNAYFDVASHILRKQGWGEPQPLVHRFKVAVETLQNLNWDNYQGKKSGIEIFPWNTLSAVQRAQIIAAARNDERFPVGLLPFNSTQGMEYAVSLGLRQGDEVLGWVIAHRLRHDLIEYSALYVKPTRRTAGAAILLLGESFRRLAATGAVNVIFQVKVGNDLMLRSVRKRIRTILSEAILCRAEKALEPVSKAPLTTNQSGLCRKHAQRGR